MKRVNICIGKQNMNQHGKISLSYRLINLESVTIFKKKIKKDYS